MRPAASFSSVGIWTGYDDYDVCLASRCEALVRIEQTLNFLYAVVSEDCLVAKRQCLRQPPIKG
jgi:hypothetical protein